MRIGLLILAILLMGDLTAQLNCKTLKGQFGDSVICYHSGGQRSTVEFRDSDQFNYRTFYAFDTKGNKIFEGGHGYRHGGGSLDVTYHSNGCVNSVRSTFQPDGGIQYYDVTTYFNEDGSFNRREDNSPDRTFTTPIEMTPEEHMEQTIYEKESVQLVLKNLTGKKVKILLMSVKDPNDRRVIEIRNGKEYSLGYFEKKRNKNLLFDYYRMEILPARKPFKTVFLTDDQLRTKEKEVTLILRLD